MLIRLLAEGEFPSTTTEAFDRGLRKLCAHDGLQRRREVSIERIIEVASLFALLVLMSNRSNLRIDDDQFAQSISESVLCEAAGGTDQAALVRQVLNTGIFDGSGTVFRFAHRSYAEFLAARALARVEKPAERAIGLLRDPNLDGAWIPQLRGLASLSSGAESSSKNRPAAKWLVTRWGLALCRVLRFGLGAPPSDLAIQEVRSVLSATLGASWDRLNLSELCERWSRAEVLESEFDQERLGFSRAGSSRSGGGYAGGLEGLVESVRENTRGSRRVDVPPPAVLALYRDSTKQLVRSDADLRRLVCERLVALEQMLTRELLWNDAPAGASSVHSPDRKHRPEVVLSDYLKELLTYELAGKKIIVNREAQVKRGQQADIFVEAPLPDGTQRVRTIIEVKWSDHNDVDKAMKTQLRDRYMADSIWNEGVYLVALCDEQPALSEKLAAQARELSVDGKTIEAVVIDVRLPPRATA